MQRKKGFPHLSSLAVLDTPENWRKAKRHFKKSLNVPLGQIAGRPLRVHDEQGTYERLFCWILGNSGNSNWVHVNAPFGHTSISALREKSLQNRNYFDI